MDIHALSASLRRHAEQHAVPGAVLGLLDGDTTAVAAAGVANSLTGEPVTSASLFSAGSLTKTMVATVAVMLATKGRWSLEDPVAMHVPELSRSGWAQLATIRDLLANRGRVPLRASLEFGFKQWSDTDDGALGRLVAQLATSEAAPDVWSYTNIGWCVLGRAIEHVTGLTWESAMQGHLLDPAGMDATVFAATAPNTVPRVAGHEATPAGPAPVEPLLARSYGPAGTNILTTADDLLRFASTLLRQAPLRDLRTVHARPSIHGWLDAWSLGGAQFDWPGATVWGWDGLINGERSVLRILPELRAAVVVLTNGNTGRAMIRSLLSELMPKLYGIVVPPLNLTPSVGVAGDLSRFAGIYAWPDRRIEVTATADALRLITDDGESEARPIDGDTFLVDAADPDTPTITFGPPGRAGRPAVLYDMLWGLGRVDP